MRGSAWLVGLAAATGLVLATTPAAHAQEPTTFCAFTPSGPAPYTCFAYESLLGAPSEVSDVVQLPGPVPAPAAMDAGLLQNPNGNPNDPKSVSDVVQFTPANAQTQSFGTIQFLSEGCSSGPTNESDTSCFPTLFTQPPAVEVQQGTGNDFQDCTQMPIFGPQGAPFAIVNACSDAPNNEGQTCVGPSCNIPETPAMVLIPLAALAVIGGTHLRRQRRKLAAVRSSLPVAEPGPPDP